ncbi:DUF3179 domain-containing (seleno)protein [Candidatus Poriferisodalis sp.]|uniref:DUF3179 domain-containing (seleno)protein n=1 Tax=Candidatus Poriferisodalis sp. TaxID=3101277 RepID=UPI003B0158FA
MRKLICVLLAATVLLAACSSTASQVALAPAPEPTTRVPADGPADESAAQPDRSSATASPTAQPTPTTQPFIPDTSDGRPFLELNLEEKIDEFLVNSNTTFAANVAAEMGQTGQRHWVPWLLDILRIGGANYVARASMRALQTLTGVESSQDPSTDYVIYGSWSRSNDIHPGAGYETWKRTLYGKIVDGQYDRLLGQVSDPVTLAAIQWGGVRRGGIPELNNPERLTPAQADFMTPEELVLGFVIGGEAGVYPVRFLARHELANDVVGGVPVVLGYCTLCLTALMFDRRLPNGDVLTFQTSGLLMDSNKIMIDNETESLWNHLSGTAFAGPLAGTRLEQYPIATARWSDWLADHPGTFTLATPLPTYFPETPERQSIAYDYTPGAAYRSYYSSEDLWFPTFETPEVFALKEEVVTVDRGEHALALGLAALSGEDPFVYVLGAEPLVIVPNPGGARVYSAADVDGIPAVPWRHGAAVEVALGGVGHDELRVNGVDGRNRIDVRLPRIVSSQSFWFAWYGLHPDTEIWPPVDRG